MQDVDIVNLALDQIGVPPLVSLTDPTEVAKKCKRAYDPQRQAALRDHVWNFAVKTESLGADATAYNPHFGASYTLPALCLRALSINDDPDAEFKIEGRHIVTDEPSVVLTYIQDVTDPTLWDALFQTAFPVRLASHLALAIPHNSTMAKDLLALYESLKTGAAGVDGQEGTQDAYQTNDLIVVRGG